MKSFIYLEMVYLVGLLVARWCLRPDVARQVPMRIVMLPVVVILLAELSPALPVYIAALFVIPFVVVRARVEAAMTMVALLLPNPSLQIPLAIGSVGLFNLTPNLAICAGCIMAGLAHKGGPQGASRGGYIFVPAMIILTLVESRATSFSFAIRNSVDHLVDVGLPCLVIAKFVTGEKDARRFLIAVIFVTAAIAALGVFEGVRNWPLYQGVFKKFALFDTLSATLNLRAGHLRSPGPYANPTDFGFALTVSALAVLSSRWAFKSLATYALLTGIFVVAILSTQSRGAVIGLFAGGVALSFYRRKVGIQASLLATAMVGALALVAVKANDGPLAETLGLKGVAAETAEYRNQLLDRGWQEFRSAPIIGRPRAQVQADLADLVQGQGIIDFVNSYLWVMIHTGICGLILFSSAIVKGVANVLPRPKDPKAPDVLGGYAFAALAAALTMLTFTSFYGIGRIWFILILSFTVVASRLKSPAARPAPQNSGNAARPIAYPGATTEPGRV